MGHAIDFLTVDKRGDIMAEACSYAFENVDRGENPSGSYHGDMTILDSAPICKDYEDAVSFLEKKARGTFYQDFAVRYYDTDRVKKTKKTENLEKRLSEMREKHLAYNDAHSVKMLSAALIGCKNCSSKIAKPFLRGNSCPVCGKDLRAGYILERLDKFVKDEAELNKAIRLEKQKAAAKAPVRWCFKVEVHC